MRISDWSSDVCSSDLGILILLVMRMLADMALAAPGAGSFTEHIRIGLGDWAGFVSGWLYWIFWMLAIALEGLAGASILVLWFPALAVWQIDRKSTRLNSSH